MLNDWKGREDSTAVGVTSEKSSPLVGRALRGVGIYGFITALSWGEIGDGDGPLGSLPRRRSMAGEYRGTRGSGSGTWCWGKDRRRASLVFSEIHAVLRLSRSQLRCLWSPFWAGGAIPAACRVLFSAVRTARHRGWTAGEDRWEITTLRAGRVRAVMLCFGVGERANGTNGKCAGTASRDVAELPALLALGVFGRGKRLFDSPVPGEEVDGGEDGGSVGRGHCDNHRGGGFLFTGFRVWVKVTCRENGDSPGIADGLVKRGEELAIV